jgi:hypothetical protein
MRRRALEFTPSSRRRFQRPENPYLSCINRECGSLDYGQYRLVDAAGAVVATGTLREMADYLTRPR